MTVCVCLSLCGRVAMTIILQGRNMWDVCWAAAWPFLRATQTAHNKQAISRRARMAT